MCLGGTYLQQEGYSSSRHCCQLPTQWPLDEFSIYILMLFLKWIDFQAILEPRSSTM